MPGEVQPERVGIGTAAQGGDGVCPWRGSRTMEMWHLGTRSVGWVGLGGSEGSSPT